MVWHVHYKDGKYQIWSTVVDAYILTEWVNADMIEQVYIERDTKRAKVMAKRNLDMAREFGCSAISYFRCDPSEFVHNSEDSQ